VVIVIGGGITGLAAAFELHLRGVPFVLLEASDRLGGLIRTERVNGFVIDAGPDSIIVQKPAGIALCEELGLARRLMPTSLPRRAFVLARGALHALPSPSVLGLPISVGSLAGYDLLPLSARVRVAMEPFVPRRSPGDESVASFFRRRFGQATVPLVAQPLLGGIHAGDIERLSMRSLFPRLVEAEAQRGKVLRTLARSLTPAPQGLFRALPSGMSELVEAIEGRLAKEAVQLRSSVRALRRDGTAWQVEVADGTTIAARAVVFAGPAHLARTLFRTLDETAAEICGTVQYVSTGSVALGFRRGDIQHPLAGSGFVVARSQSDARITACTWVSSKWPGRAPEGHALLRAFTGGGHDRGVVEMDDASLVDLAMRDLGPVLGITGDPVLRRVYRWRDAGAQHNVGHATRMAALGRRLDALPGLFVAGSGFEAIGIPDCVAHGRRSAARAADYARMGS
jgi:oxygen-dependent protoporphyrinogen oxidase